MTTKYNNITIVIPVYNCEKYISRCLDSIINQSYKSIEIILINDGSTDNTLSKCNEYAKKYENIQVINQHNKGVSFSRNIGLKNAQGKYILFVDADDYLIENSFDNIEELLNDDLDIIRFSYIIKNKNKVEKVIFDEKKYDLNIEGKEKILKNFIENPYENMVWGQLIKRELLIDMSFKENLFYAEDFLFNYELYNVINNIKYTKKIIYNYEKNENSITMNFENNKIINKIENLLYVFNKIISENKIITMNKCLEIKFLKELIPLIMMLVFEKGIKKQQIIKQYKEIIENDLLKKIFLNIEGMDLKKYKYKKIYIYMRNNKFNLLYMYSKIYMILKKIQRILNNH